MVSPMVSSMRMPEPLYYKQFAQASFIIFMGGIYDKDNWEDEILE